MLLGNISLKLALQVAKLMNTIYLAKWEGSVSLNRLRQIKGDDFVFINVSSERESDLAVVEKEMKSHGILYARMPDLCGGDARTQYAIASSDAVKMKAMLLDHTAGPNSHIRVGPISEADYMMTGKKADGTDTKEMDALNRSAKKTADAAVKKDQEPSADKSVTKNVPTGKADQKREKRRVKDREKVMSEPSGVPEKARTVVPFEKRSLQKNASPVIQAEQQIREASSDVRMRVRETVAAKGENSVYWISQKPLYENRQFAQFLLPDGIHSIFIRQEDILPFKDVTTGKRMAAIFKDQAYSMMNMQKVDVVAADGTKAIAMFKLPGGAVVAQGSQQPDRSKTGPKMEKGAALQKPPDGTGKTVPIPKKGRQR